MTWIMEHTLLIDVVQLLLFLAVFVLVAKLSFDIGRENRRPLKLTIDLEGVGAMKAEALSQYLSTTIFEQMVQQGHSPDVVFVMEGGTDDASDRE